MRQWLVFCSLALCFFLVPSCASSTFGNQSIRHQNGIELKKVASFRRPCGAFGEAGTDVVSGAGTHYIVRSHCSGNRPLTVKAISLVTGKVVDQVEYTRKNYSATPRVFPFDDGAIVLSVQGSGDSRKLCALVWNDASEVFSRRVCTRERAYTSLRDYAVSRDGKTLLVSHTNFGETRGVDIYDLVPGEFISLRERLPMIPAVESLNDGADVSLEGIISGGENTLLMRFLFLYPFHAGYSGEKIALRCSAGQRLGCFKTRLFKFDLLSLQAENVRFTSPCSVHLFDNNGKQFEWSGGYSGIDGNCDPLLFNAADEQEWERRNTAGYRIVNGTKSFSIAIRHLPAPVLGQRLEKRFGVYSPYDEFPIFIECSSLNLDHCVRVEGVSVRGADLLIDSGRRIHLYKVEGSM